MTEKAFSILTFGYGYRLIDVLWKQVAMRTGYRICHVPHPSLFPTDTKKIRGAVDDEALYYLFESPPKYLAKADLDYLLDLEGDEGPTIHNVILGDRRLSALAYHEAVDYVFAASKRLERIFTKFMPDVVLSGFEGFHSTLSMLVCKKLRIPWFGIVYTPIPPGMTGFSATNNSKGTKSFGESDRSFFSNLAEQTLLGFEKRSHVVHVPETESSIKNIVKFIPQRFNNALLKYQSLVKGNFDRHTHRSFFDSTKNYMRRRWNYFSNQRLDLLENPPKKQYVFFGFHMQPEMGIDVWAPFFSNQPHVIESIARAVPPTHLVMVKLHKIDSDYWSNKMLRRIEKMPGVKLVSAKADTQSFIRKADIVFSIQGTIALEAALLGRPVVSFGETMYEDFTTVTRIGRLADLPRLVRSKLKEPVPSRAEISAGFEKLLSRFRRGIYNNWDVEPSNEQLNDFCEHLESMRKSILPVTVFKEKT